ncbi:hypothetical protein FRX31_022705 [Thalictrum thalictroides]|uniref:Reverse transcriptase zinc-binding domain n=1 Tax=Thalictrum thalictroides TaxID=46969 RepID=A0A7J6VSJ8_THATH|nr:hypothetical protein FRX31_022705 [Thalictrum thalictroides]
MNGVLDHNSPHNFLLNWPKLNARGLTKASWNILPYAVLWVLWCERNDIIFNNVTFSIDNVIRTVKCTIWGWIDIVGKAVDVKKDHTCNDLLLSWESIVRDFW